MQPGASLTTFPAGLPLERSVLATSSGILSTPLLPQDLCTCRPQPRMFLTRIADWLVSLRLSGPSVQVTFIIEHDHPMESDNHMRLLASLSLHYFSPKNLSPSNIMHHISMYLFDCWYILRWRSLLALSFVTLVPRIISIC